MRLEYLDYQIVYLEETGDATVIKRRSFTHGWTKVLLLKK